MKEDLIEGLTDMRIETIKCIRPRIRRVVSVGIGTMSAIVSMLIFNEEIFQYEDFIAFVAMLVVILISRVVVEIPFRLTNRILLPGKITVAQEGIYCHVLGITLYLKASKVRFSNFDSSRGAYDFKEKSVLCITDDRGRLIAFINDVDNTMEDKIKLIFKGE